MFYAPRPVWRRFPSHEKTLATVVPGAGGRAFAPSHTPRRLRLRLAVLVLAPVILALGCAGTSDQRAVATTTAVPTGVPPELGADPGASVPATLAVPDGFILADTRGVVIPPVLGKPKGSFDHTKPVLPVEGGTATIHGVVYGPDGVVEGATVRLERFVGEDWGYLDVGTGKDGKYAASGLLGGRYRVRAWQKPSLSTVEPPALFLSADHGDAVVDIGTEKHEAIQIQGALVTAEPHVGEHVFFQALLTREEVDDNGIVQGLGIEGSGILLSPIDGIRVFGKDLQLTGADGFATFDVMCLTTGVHSVIVQSGDRALALGLPSCLDGTVPDTSVDSSASTTTKPRGPTTTKPGATTTTKPKATTTTKPVAP